MIRKAHIIFILISVLISTGVYSAEEKSAIKSENNKGITETQKDKTSSSGDKKTKKEDELARVGIMSFEDRTNSKYFAYMANSLSDAINTSMLKDFSYIRVEPDAIKQAVEEVRQEILDEKTKNKNKPAKKPRAVTKKTKSGNEKENESPKKEKSEAELLQDEEQLDFIKRLAQKSGSDIVIYGVYNYDEEAKEIVFTVSLYLALSDSVRELDETRSPVDNTLFNATNNVAKYLVYEIHRMIDEVEKKNDDESVKEVAKKEDAAQDEYTPDKIKRVGDNQPENKPQEKVALTRKVAMAPNPDWATKKFSLTISPGFLLTLPVDSPVPPEICGTCQIQASLLARFWITPGLYAGAKFDFSELWNDLAPMGSTPVFSGFAFLGYGIPVNRWLFSADIGAGYFLIMDRDWGAIYNPAFNARIGAEVLLSESFSISLSANACMFYDEPNPLLFTGLALTLNYSL